MPIKSIEKAITDHRPIKRDTHIACQACPDTTWTIGHLYDEIKAVCNAD